MYLALSWLYTVFVTIFIYAFIYFGVSKFDQHAFSSASNSLEFFDFLHFSIGIITTAGGSSIHGTSFFAKLLSTTEYLHIPFLLIAIVFIGFTTQRETYRENAEDFRLALQELSNIIEIQINNTYQTTALAIEAAIHKHNSWLVTRLRRARGMSELINEEPPKPEQTTATAPSPSVNTPPKNNV
jgi:Na+-transporting methylmalonyl-CoA/oxaloacetate decarboxylase gamma subunit